MMTCELIQAEKQKILDQWKARLISINQCRDRLDFLDFLEQMAAARSDPRPPRIFTDPQFMALMVLSIAGLLMYIIQKG